MNVDLTGQQFTHLKVLEFSHSTRDRYWKCECICGNITLVTTSHLTSGHNKSCGCVRHTLRFQTNMDKYGQKHFIDKMQDSLFETHGVLHCMHVKEYALKNAKATNKAVILKHWKTNEDLICQGSYERKVVAYLNLQKIEFTWQSTVFEMPDKKTYRPDLYLISQALWIEIKGYFRKDALEKWNWFSLEHPNSQLWDKNKLTAMKIL